MKKLFVLVLTIASVACYSQTLSLKEKQAIAELDFSWAEKRVLENYGTAVSIELDKNTVAGDMDAILYADSRGAQVAANAIARICGNNIGKEALQEQKIKKIIIRNLREGKAGVEIKSGVMTLSQGLSSEDNYLSDAELRDTIEKGL